MQLKMAAQIFALFQIRPFTISVYKYKPREVEMNFVPNSLDNSTFL